MIVPARRVDLDEYLRIDESNPNKHEYLNGQLVAMAGASPRHNLIAANVSAALGQILGQTPCLVLSSDQRVRISETGAYVYPDVTVVCDAPRFTDERPQSLLNPRFVVEVLSPSTEEHDRGVKLAHYRRLASIEEILLIEPNRRHLEHYRRLPGGRWLITELADGQLELSCLGGQLSVLEAYAKVDALPLDE